MVEVDGHSEKSATKVRTRGGSARRFAPWPRRSSSELAFGFAADQLGGAYLRMRERSVFGLPGRRTFSDPLGFFGGFSPSVLRIKRSTPA